MAVQKLGTLLGKAGEFQTLMRKTRQLAAWHELYARLVPPALANGSRVAGFRAGTLVLWADNAAVAAKLKQLTPRLITALNQQAVDVTSIRVQVQPAHATPSAKKNRAGLQLSRGAVEAFDRLSAEIPESPLKHAVETLVARRRGKTPA